MLRFQEFLIGKLLRNGIVERLYGFWHFIQAYFRRGIYFLDETKSSIDFLEEKMKKKDLALPISCMIASLTFTSAFAAGRYGFSENVDTAPMQTSYERERSPEEWASLRDNTISWEEIADLVHEYNPTVSSLWINFRDSERRGSYSVDVEAARAQVEDAYEKAMAAANGNAVAEALAEMQYQTNSSNFSADSVAQNSDRELAKLSIEQTEKNTVETVKKSFISRENTILQKEIDAVNLEDRKSEKETAERKKAIGQATEIDVLTAKTAADQAELQLASDDGSIKKTSELLQVSLGWKADANPVFPSIPETTKESVEQISLSEDTKKALDNNLSLQISTRKLNLSEGEANRENLSRTIENQKEKIQSDLLSRYQSLREALDAQAQAILQEENAKKAYEKAERGLKLGSVSVKARNKAKNAYTIASLEKRQADLKLTEEVLDYQAGVNGLCSAD